jgi:arabinose-5-phosphate isomerase
VVTAERPNRLAESNRVHRAPGGLAMTRAPKTAQADELAAAVLGRMERHGIMAMPVLSDDGRIVGVVHLHDLMRAGAV